MNELDDSVFSKLFREAYQKCFGIPLKDPLTETESKLFSGKIFDQTGLVIGSKSIKNYSAHVTHRNGKGENPSVASLDTLARYVLNAPYTDELRRKDKESHYPYWFQYKNQYHSSVKKPVRKRFLSYIMITTGIIVFSALTWALFHKNNADTKEFRDDFSAISEDSLLSKGWLVLSKDEQYWKRRNEQPGQLVLFTLKGDNWPDSLHTPAIKNLIVRENSAQCFIAEVHLTAFMPTQNWQQAGLLLLEDTNFTGKSLRLSLLYNDYYGGFPKSSELIGQAIISKGKEFSKPEEIAHQLIFKFDSTNRDLVSQNLQHFALRIEKHEKKYRLLYANGSMANSAFKEILSMDIDLAPEYIGLFALKGFVDSADVIPAAFDFFSLRPEKCK